MIDEYFVYADWGKGLRVVHIPRVVVFLWVDIPRFVNFSGR